MTSLFDVDLHVHTQLYGCCSDPHQTVAEIAQRAAQLGLRTIGLTDHVWDNPAWETTDWYRPQNVARLLPVRAQIAALAPGVHVMLGCEAEYAGDGHVGITAERAAQLDFVLLACSHLHMHDLVRQPADASPRALAMLLLQLFREGVQSGVAHAIAHPFSPHGRPEQACAALAAIRDAEFRDAFALAAQYGVAIELHPAHFSACCAPPGDPARDAAYARMLILAREAGVAFTIGSDAHTRDGIGTTLRMHAAIMQLGIRGNQLASWACR
ncbi:MAG: PHP domain-containing protein [bacterium]|nr:PHP domain-containing protein [bacterium]